jgi:hypothetical protein
MKDTYNLSEFGSLRGDGDRGDGDRHQRPRISRTPTSAGREAVQRALFERGSAEVDAVQSSSAVLSMITPTHVLINDDERF